MRNRTIQTRKELEDLAKDVRKAAYLEFFIGSDDRTPDGDRLSDCCKAIIAAALDYQAKNDPTLGK